MKVLFLLCVLPLCALSMDKPDVKPLDYHTFLESMNSINNNNNEVTLNIPPSAQDKEFVITKTKIAAAVTVSLALITAGVTLGIHFAQCDKDID